MEETIERPGLFTRLFAFARREEEEFEDIEAPTGNTFRVHTTHRYSITVRRQIVSFQDAVAAADGIKRGEQQVLNLAMASTELREKIKDFMCGVNYAAEGTWEEIGENVYLLAPAMANVEVAPPSPRMQAQRN
ncbi:MAG: cell division protein SepF [Fimbriimonadaceae bacterium]|nr:cell division protein SepF [Fimbriimonadaceae bacterium]QYK54901.1 MAG: cell division protein SepF [Fimbriimonadaceae bacterium]